MSKTTLLSAVFVGTLMIVGGGAKALGDDFPEHQALHESFPEHQEALCRIFEPEKCPQNAQDLYRFIQLADQNAPELFDKRVHLWTIQNFLMARFRISSAQILQWAGEILENTELVDELRSETQCDIREFVKNKYSSSMELLLPLLFSTGEPKNSSDLAALLGSDVVYRGPIPVYEVETALYVLHGIPIETLRKWEREILVNPAMLPQLRGDPKKQAYYGPLEEIERLVKFVETGRYY
jgi:hypothetical protein